MINLGAFAPGSTVLIPFTTSDSSGGAVTFTGTVSNVRVYKGSSTTERSSTAGITLTKDHDSDTGSHLLAIDTSDDTDSGFYAEGQVYTVKLDGITVDSQTVTAYIGAFTLESVYYADIEVYPSDGGTDKWIVTWFRDGAPVTSGVTGTPTLQAISFNGTDLFTAQSLTTAVVGTYTLEESTNVVTLGEPVVGVAAATIDGIARSWRNAIVPR